MDQETDIQAPASQDQVKVLTELMQQLLRENLTAYPELTEALPSIEEDFFRSLLTEEERKFAIQFYPRTISNNYNPPLLKDSASSAVKKADTDILHKGLELPGKPTRLVDSDTKTLMGQKALDALIAKKPASKRQRVQPISKRKQSSNNKDFNSSNTVMAQSTSAATSADTSSGHKTSDRQPQEAHPLCGRAKLQDGDSEFHLSHDTQEGLSHVIGSSRCFHEHTRIQEVQKIYPLSLECPPFSVPRSAIRAVTLPIGIHKDFPPSTGIGENEGNQNFCVLGRFTDLRRDQRIFQSEHTISLLQTLGAWIQGQLREVLYQPVPVNRPSRDGPIELGSSTNCENHASKTLETQKKSYVDIEFMYIDCNSDEACHSAPELLEEPTVVMERALILARDARAGCLHGLQRFSMGNCSGPPLLLRNMESTTCEDAHKCKRATDGALCAEAQECDGCISFSLFRQHNHPLLRQ
ncbi:hypothetical protein AYI69_g8629 [Smittium culicis]|uniref:Uncharacterized protein n=1 Tax=Smittium culicis TaxID=133412 RepID=A0A1R1XIF6_9FUNG|nr:hypothetical protein AYI69_g8629 [Smittium culicis]